MKVTLSWLWRYIEELDTTILILTLALEGGGELTPSPGRFTPRKRVPASKFNILNNFQHFVQCFVSVIFKLSLNDAAGVHKTTLVTTLMLVLYTELVPKSEEYTSGSHFIRAKTEKYVIM
jgi:hypothetical protein